MQQCFKYFKATVKIYQLLICLVDKFTKHVKRKKNPCYKSEICLEEKMKVRDLLVGYRINFLLRVCWRMWA